MDTPLSALSRRDFLKLASYGMLGLSLPDFPLRFSTQPFYADLQGRVIEKSLWMYDEPSSKSKRIEMYWRDLVIAITGAAISDDKDAYNRVWYEVDDGKGYVYSGGIQPVNALLNKPVSEIPPSGLLGEISVPFSDAHEEPGPDSTVAHRLYYETVHWITDAVVGADGQTWYRLLDDKWDLYYYTPAKHLRIIPDDELAPISPDVPDAEKLIEVNLTRQLVLAYESSRLVFAARAATGSQYRSGRWTTPIGQFITSYKRPTRHMAAGDIASNGFDLPGVPWVLYITKSGISFHGTYWHNDYGRPRSHGCINMTPQASKWLYRWTAPTVEPGKQFAYEYFGTKVLISE
jgi:lipoprotein-anchoring transpeptidase ErfK/SrfK